MGDCFGLRRLRFFPGRVSRLLSGNLLFKLFGFWAHIICTLNEVLRFKADASETHDLPAGQQRHRTPQGPRSQVRSARLLPKNRTTMVIASSTKVSRSDTAHNNNHHNNNNRVNHTTQRLISALIRTSPFSGHVAIMNQVAILMAVFGDLFLACLCGFKF